MGPFKHYGKVFIRKLEIVSHRIRVCDFESDEPNIHDGHMFLLNSKGRPLKNLVPQAWVYAICLTLLLMKRVSLYESGRSGFREKHKR